MAFIAELKGKVQEGGNMRFFVTFTDGATSLQKEIIQPLGGVNVEAFKREVGKILSDLNNPTTISDGQIDTTPEPETPKTPSEIDRDAWLQDWNNLVSANKLIDAGVIDATLPAYVALKAKVKTNFKNGYINLV